MTRCTDWRDSRFRSRPNVSEHERVITAADWNRRLRRLERKLQRDGVRA